MQVQQISIFLENRVGRLQEVTEVLGKNDINIRALSLAESSGGLSVSGFLPVRRGRGMAVTSSQTQPNTSA